MSETKLYQVENGWIETYVGEQFHFMDPDPLEISLFDVAHALSQLCRYNGHTKKFYSVAEHSVLIAEWLINHNHRPEIALTGLLHDAAEAYIGDMPRPIKVKLPDFKELEKRIDFAVGQRFGIFYPFPDIIHELDSRILRDEREQIMNASGHEWGTDKLRPLGVKVRGWRPRKARRRFLKTYRKLCEQIAAENFD